MVEYNNTGKRGVNMSDMWHVGHGTCDYETILADTYTNELKNTKDRQLDSTLGSNIVKSQMTLSKCLKKSHNKFDYLFHQRTKQTV